MTNENSVSKTGPTIDKGNSRQDYGTPRDFLDAVEARYGKLDFDLAADRNNCKAGIGLFFNEEADALSREWPKGILCWLNPPFSKIGPWAKKCLEESRSGSRILFLVPASVGSNWFRDYVHGNAWVNFLNGRLTFEGESDPYPKDLILCEWNIGFGRPGYGIWDWRK